jgi:p21-activated kinase 1
MNEKTPPRVSENQLISPKRYSDESKEPKPGMIRKKSGFSGFMSSIGVGSPRGVKISAPENPVHVTHVGYDSHTGQFTVSRSLKCRITRLLIFDLGTSEGMAAHD